MIDEGCIHGRFQPFHNEHLDYALEAFERCIFLWIGLTESFQEEHGMEGPAHRLTPTANPLSYHERQFMITRTLVCEGIEPERFAFVPFPVRTPELLRQFLALPTTCFLTINDDWNRQKRQLLQSAGYPVEVLYERPKGIEAADIRALLIAGNDFWRELVPTSVASYLDEIDLATRLRALPSEPPNGQQ